ncbi:hypothetical protein MFIFM68171_04928 [Madurella fahalii]|uniref:Heterokaryon incompatibility domain-containing protein n=1 Tax=Madurella fahalii TaxID=1157608 RepID=A0ABQ0GAB4_9PEZI
MRLLNTATLELQECNHDNVPPYAILSHTWGPEEVTFQVWQDRERASQNGGFMKIQNACMQARRDRIGYIWADTCCIDKTSSAELSEAINSMFKWYRASQVCYVYLSDVPDWDMTAGKKRRHPDDDNNEESDVPPALRQSRWFRRGWTLQELLAPTHVVFYSSSWTRIGTKANLKTPLSQITGIPADYLTGHKPVWMASVAKRMSWMAKRATTRIEDMAYSMLGIFDIYMPLLYGEGSRAFLRLQEEIIKTTDDHSIFCWEWDRALVDDRWASVLAPCPAVFSNAGEYMPTSWEDDAEVTPYNISNAGLSIRLPLVATANPHLVLAVLEATAQWQSYPYLSQLCVPLQRGRIYRRLPFPTTKPFLIDMAMVDRGENIYIMASERSPELRRGYITSEREVSALFSLPRFDVGFLLAFSAETPKVEVIYSTDGLLLFEPLGVLGFNGFDILKAPTDRDIFALGVIRLTFKDGIPSLVILAVRRRRISTAKAPDFTFYCQALPSEIAQTIPRVVEEVEIATATIQQDVDFSSDGVTTVALGDLVPYPVSVAGPAPVVKFAQVVRDDDERSDVLRENSDYSAPLFCEGDGGIQTIAAEVVGRLDGGKRQ